MGNTSGGKSVAGDESTAPSVVLAPTCLVDLVSPEVACSATRILRSLGLTVNYPFDQTCCGQPAWNAGFAEEAASVARHTLEALDQAGVPVVVLGGSCTTMQRQFWPELFDLVGDRDAADRARALAERTFEFSEFLAARGRRLPHVESDSESTGDPTPVAYHHSCHMLRELRISEQPESLLDEVTNLRRVEWDPDRRCCGFGGLFSTKLPETSTAMADAKLDAAMASGARIVVGCDSSCLLHLRTRAEHRGLPLQFEHLAEILDDSPASISDRERPDREAT